MISCKECASLNSLDSAFCKKCGKPLAQESAIDAREHVEKQIDHGFDLFHHGRTDEAWLIAETSLNSDPDNLRAMSLKGMILERRGLILEAIECYEVIVKKDPNAALERMKLQTLRGVLDARKSLPPQQPNRKAAIGIAACAMLLVMSLAAAITVSQRNAPSTVAKNGTPQQQFSVAPFTQKDQNQSVQGDTSTNPTDEGATTKTTQGQPDAADRTAAPTTGLPRPDQAILDAQGNKPLNPLQGQISPLQQNTQALPSTTPTETNTQTPQGDPDPSTAAAQKTDAAQEPPAVVDIKLSDDRQGTGSDQALDKNGIEALVRTARGQYQVGSYQAAASTYERALGAGADPALVNQRLGQCYEKLGRVSDAVSAYSRAISSLQAEIDGGRGDKNRLLAALDSSKQALKNLQGG